MQHGSNLDSYFVLIADPDSDIEPNYIQKFENFMALCLIRVSTMTTKDLVRYCKIPCL